MMYQTQQFGKKQEEKRKEKKRETLTGARRGVVEKLVGVGVEADDAEGVAAALTDPSREIRIYGKVPTFFS